MANSTSVIDDHSAPSAMATPPAAAAAAGSSPIPTLHHLTSSQSLRVLWALEELAMANHQPFNLKVYKRQKGRAPPELKEIFPLGKSPILEVHGVAQPVHPAHPPALALNTTTTATGTTAGGMKDGDRIIVTETRLILQYLADHYSQGIWTPSTPADRTRDIYWQEFASCTLSPIVERILIFDMISSNSPLLARPVTWPIFHPFVTMFKKDLVAPFELMERSLSGPDVDNDGHGKWKWFSGAKIGLADFCMSWPMDLASQRKFFDPEKYPKLAAWLRRVHAREAYQRAVDRSGSYDLVSFDM